MIRLYLVLALAAIQLVASDSCDNSVTISSQSDANAISNCEDIGGSVTIKHDATGTIKLDNVQEIHGDFTIDGTSGLTKVSASNLDSVKRDFSVRNNGELSELSMSNLETVGGSMKIQSNDNLKQLQFNNLEVVKGNMRLSGPFNSISFSNLEHVKGQASIRTSGSMSCSDLSQLKSNNVFGGSLSCSTGSTSTSSSSPSSTAASSTSSSSSGSSGLSDGGKAGVAVGVIVGVALIAGAIWFMLRRRKRGADFHTVPTANADADDPEKGAMQSTAAAGAPTSPPPGPPPVVAGSVSRKPVTPALPGGEPNVPMLDSGNVHEAPAMPTSPARDAAQVFELDAGPVHGTHQQAINHE